VITLLHTSDWHLGRILDQKSLLDDQRWVLQNRFLPLVDQVRPDAVLIAGDVYDRQVSPQDAIALLNDVLQELVLAKGIPVVMIAGNHDSGARLAFGSDLLRLSGLYIAGRPCASPFTVHLPKKDLLLAGLPYFDPVEVRALLGDDSITDHQAALEKLLAHWRGQLPPASTTVLLAHLFVQGGKSSESERILAPGQEDEVGGAGQVPASLFQGWDFTALGHLHVPQQPAGRVSYSGSLLQYSFSEPANKSATVVELEPGALPRLTRLPMEPLHRLRTLRGTFDGVLDSAAADSSREDYLRIEYDSAVPVPFVMERFRERFPNVLEVVRRLPEAPDGTPATVLGIGHVREFSLRQLLDSFLQYTDHEAVSGEGATILGELASAVETEREGDLQ